jgi:alpha-tubulin suppressor-like RCC1 family protein
VKVSGLGRPRHLTAGGGITGTAPDLGADGHTCALVDDEVWCWGDNRHGQLGDGTTEDRAEPVRVQGLDDAKWVEAGGGPRRLPDDSSESRAHTCALRADDRFVCWGDNDQGQLGDGSENRATRPVEVELPRE